MGRASELFGRSQPDHGVGVRNLFERDPPFSAVAFTGFDPAYADPRGRTYYARLTCAFR